MGQTNAAGILIGHGSMIRHLSKFFSVGLLATLSHVAVATFCANFLVLNALLANFLGFSAAVMLSYFGHARLTFEHKVLHGSQFSRFVVAALAGLALSSAITWLCHDRLGMPFWFAMLLAAVLVPAFNYAIFRLWVFVPARKNADVD
jgi:putative flippase GtrA